MRTTRSKKQRGGVISKAKANADLFKAALIEHPGPSLRAVKKALADGAVVNSRHTFHESEGVDATDGSTALMNASMLGHANVVEFLLEKGANPTLKDDEDWTALDVAGENGHEVIAEMLEQPDLFTYRHGKAVRKPTTTIRSRNGRSGGKRKTRKSKKTRKTRRK